MIKKTFKEILGIDDDDYKELEKEIKEEEDKNAENKEEK